MVAGVGGMGKSTLTRYLVACLTTGRPAFGLEYPPPPPCDVLLASVEDNAEDTIIPHLIAEGADLARVHTIDGVKKADGALMQFDLRDLDLVLAKIREKPQIRLLIIDPIMSFVGRAGLNENASAEVRSILDPLIGLAEQTALAILLVAHLNKATGASAVNRITGSGAFRDTCRVVYAMGADPQDANRRVMALVKPNVPGLDRGSLAFTLVPVEGEELGRVLSADEFADLGDDDRALIAEQLFRVVPGGHVDLDADTALGTRAVGTGANRVEQCIDWLREFLKDYAYPSAEIAAAAKKAGFSFDALKHAKARIGRDGTGELANRNYGNGRNGVNEWWSGLGPWEGWTKRPDPASSNGATHGSGDEPVRPGVRPVGQDRNDGPDLWPH